MQVCGDMYDVESLKHTQNDGSDSAAPGNKRKKKIKSSKKLKTAK